MPRGKTEATKLKEAIRVEMRSQLAKATVAATLREKRRIADYKAHSKKPLLESLREHIGKAIDRIDPLEAAAILGATVLIKQGIDWAEVGVTDLTFSVTRAMTWMLSAEEKAKLEQLIAIAKDQAKAYFSGPEVELVEWLLSFCAAYYLTKNPPTVGSIVSGAKGLFGL